MHRILTMLGMGLALAASFYSPAVAAEQRALRLTCAKMEDIDKTFGVERTKLAQLFRDIDGDVWVTISAENGKAIIGFVIVAEGVFCAAALRGFTQENI